jgi:predicted transcriptional regulator
MKPSLARAFALIIVIFLISVPAAAINIGGYSVTPGEISVLQGQPTDPVLISFWDLDLRGMLIVVCLSLCPLLVYPVELFFFLKMMMALGYRKVEQNAILRNRNRQKIFETIAANPGVKFHALERLTTMKEGTLKYHLLILETKRWIVSVSIGKSMRYFENNGRYSKLEKRVLLHLQNPTTRKILEILSASPMISRKEIAGIMGITGPSVSWHTKRLSEDGIITTCQKWRAVRYTLCPADEMIFRKYLKEAALTVGIAAGKEPGTGSLKENR